MYNFISFVGACILLGILIGIFARLGAANHLMAMQNWRLDRLLAQPAPPTHKLRTQLPPCDKNVGVGDFELVT